MWSAANPQLGQVVDRSVARKERPRLKGKRDQGLVSIPGPGARSLGSAGAVPGVFVVGESTFNHCIRGCT